ncbi:MAG: CbtA family protein [Mycobacterium sp.]
MEKKFIGLGIAAGVVGGLAAFVLARSQVTPAIAAAIDYEEGRSAAEALLSGEHEHGHELFSRALQANVGAGLATVGFGMVIGALFAVAFSVVWAYLGRRYPTASPRLVALALAGAGFVAVYLVPFLGYPASPPGVGSGETIGDRTTAYLVLVLVSLASSIAAFVGAGRLSPRIGAFPAAVAASVGYVAAVIIALTVLPTYDETPGPLVDELGVTVFPGFPAEVLADFRLYSMLSAAVMWIVVGAAFAMGVPRVIRDRSAVASHVVAAAR